MQELKKTYNNNKKLGVRMIADYFVSHYHIKTIKEGAPEMYYYKDGIYTRAEQEIEAALSKLLGQDYSINVKNEVMNQIHSKTYFKRADFTVDKYLINLNNGVYNMRSGAFTDHTPLNLFFTKIDTDYKPKTTCKKIDAFLMELLPLEDVELLKQWFGYCLFRDYFIKKALIMTGEKNTGKTTVIDLFVKLIGLHNISGVSLQQMASDKFSVADMYNKHVNIYDDMSAGDVKDSGRFKMVTGRSPISAEHKYGNRFAFYNYSKLTFACNRIPNVEDNDDDAYFERWIIIKFTKTVEEPDKFLLDKLATPDELSGLLNSLIIALNKLLVNEKFNYNKTHEEIREEMLRGGSPVASFVYECMEEAIGDWISKNDLHYYYTQYARMNNLPYVEIKKFGKELVKYARYCTEGRHQNNKGWNNAKIYEEYKVQFDGYQQGGGGVDETELSGSENNDAIEEGQTIKNSNETGAEENNSDEDRRLRDRLDEVV